jgi:hypothetical protein
MARTLNNILDYLNTLILLAYTEKNLQLVPISNIL